MRRIWSGALLLTGLLACSDDPGRRPADEPASQPVEIARADSGLIPLEDSIAPEDTAGQEVSPVEEQPPKAISAPAPAPPRPARRAKPAAPRPAPPVEPEPEPEPEPAAEALEPAAEVGSGQPPVEVPPDTSPAPATDADTAVAAPMDTARPTVPPPPVRPPDTVGTSRPIPPASPRPVVPSMESASPEGGAAVTLPAGTEFHAALVDSIHSRRDSAGQSLTAKVMENVLSPDGTTLIPAGTTVRLTLLRLEPAKSKSAADGKLELRVDGIARGEELLEVTAEVRPIPHELRGRGVTGSEAAKVGAGAAAGAIAGRVLGGDTRGAVIGGVVGAAGGAAVASQTADRDIVVKAGTPISFVLTAPLTARRL